MKRILISGGLAVLVIPSLLYYITKYYICKSLTFEESVFIFFVVFCSLMIFGLLIGVFSAYQLYRVSKDNTILHNELNELKEQMKNYHYDNIEYHENNRDLILDLGGE